MNTSDTHALQTEKGEVDVPARRDIPERVTIVDGTLTLAGRIWQRGDVIVLDDATIESTVDRDDHTFLSELSERAQMRRWGRVMLAEGDISQQLREADRAASQVSEARRAEERERSGFTFLAEGWAEEDARARQPRRTRSTTTSSLRTMT